MEAPLPWAETERGWNMAKDLAALQKDIDEVRKWFQDEKDSVHKQLDAITDSVDELRQWFLDEKKVTGEARKWFVDEKAWTHKELDDIDKRLDKLTQTLVQVAAKARPK